MQKILVFDNELSGIVLGLQEKFSMTYQEVLLGLKLTENRILNMQNTTAAYRELEQLAAANQQTESEDHENEIKNINE